MRLECYVAYGSIYLDNDNIKEYSWVVLYMGIIKCKLILDGEIHFWDPVTGVKNKFEQKSDLKSPVKYKYYKVKIGVQLAGLHFQ